MRLFGSNNFSAKFVKRTNEINEIINEFALNLFQINEIINEIALYLPDTSKIIWSEGTYFLLVNQLEFT